MNLEPFLSLLPTASLVVGSAMFCLWVTSLFINDVSIVDIAWGLGFVVLGWLGWLQLEEPSVRQTLVLVLVTIWGSRLGFYLARRNLGHGEDYRYTQIRNSIGPFFRISSLWIVFGMQGTVMLLVASPVLFVMGSPEATAPLGFTDYLGLSLWAIGFYFEAVGDWQLKRFKADPVNKGKVMNQGLWRYTRHPNYFGDSCLWWGFFVIAAGIGGLWTIIGPIMMTFFLLKVTGVLMLEKTMRKREKYKEYIETTSTFFPMPPKRPS
ncbi:MAG: DUF1295 domain-containing protein [Myxococcota bacterium]|nr:DUF1295 domain-containing protein [Myxococcota bacterium]